MIGFGILWHRLKPPFCRDSIARNCKLNVPAPILVNIRTKFHTLCDAVSPLRIVNGSYAPPKSNQNTFFTHGLTQMGSSLKEKQHAQTHM